MSLVTRPYKLLRPLPAVIPTLILETTFSVEPVCRIMAFSITQRVCGFPFSSNCHAVSAVSLAVE